jgi:hypothetical protein
VAHRDYKVWFTEEGGTEHSVNIKASFKEDAVDKADNYLNSNFPGYKFTFNYIQTPEGDFKKMGRHWVPFSVNYGSRFVS